MKDHSLKYDIIAILERSHADESSGLVKILFYYDVDNPKVIRPTDPEIFTHGKCWISKGYPELVAKVQEHEPFIVKNIAPTDHQVDDLVNSDSRVDWWGQGSSVDTLTDSSLVPIFRCSLPSLDYGELKDVDVWGFTRIMILNEDHLYGPFDITVVEDQNEKKLRAAASVMALALPLEHVMKISFSTVNETDVFVEPPEDYLPPIEGFITALSDFKREFRGGWEEVDYIGNDRLMKYISNLGGRSSGSQLMTRKEHSAIANEIREFVDSKKEKMDNPYRLKRAIGLLESLDKNNKESVIVYDTFVESFLNSANGKDEVKKWAKSNKTFMGENKKVDVATNKDEEKTIVKLTKEIGRLISRKDEIQDQVVDAQKELDKTKTKSKENIKNKGDKDLKQLNNTIELRQSDLAELEENIITLHQTLGLSENIEKLQLRKDLLEEDLRKIRSLVGELEDKLKNPDNLGFELAKLNTLLRLLNTGTADDGVDTLGEYSAPPLVKLNSQDKSSMSDVMVTISEKLNEPSGRPFSEAEVANLMICTQQNLLTILHGRPGVGKTSTAIKLAKTMGLDGDEAEGSSNFLNISVGRGWMSTRDLIGYYNGLKDMYQPARTGLYNFLKQGTTVEAKNTLRLVLLDEANLSPLEHYWSDFIGLCDHEGYDGTINTGIPKGNGSFQVNKNRNLRFIATINNDSTTEPLSPRLLDRAPVISMDILDDNGVNSGVALQEMTGALPLDFLEKNLGTISKAAESVNDNEEGVYTILEEMIKIAKAPDPELGEQIEISPRRYSAINRYVSTAAIYMEDHVATDFAIAQFLLPLIAGDQSGFIHRLEEMHRYANSNRLNRSEKIISRIISRGNTYLNSYSFL
jgi:hypothetical protein